MIAGLIVTPLEILVGLFIVGVVSWVVMHFDELGSNDEDSSSGGD